MTMKLLVMSPLLYHSKCGNGGGAICFRLLEGLAARHKVVFVCFSVLGAAEEARARAELAGLCAEVHVLPLRPVGAVTRLRWRLAQWLGGPPVDARGFDTPHMRAVLQGVLAEFKPDLALLQFPYMAQYVTQLPGVPTVMDVQDVFFVSRLREYAVQTRRVARLKRLVAWLAWTRYEMAFYGHCQQLMALTEEDRAALHALVPAVPSFVNMAAIAARVPTPIPAQAALRVGFGGSFDHPPNLDALSWLNADIAPRVAALVPGVQISVAGKGVPDAMKAALHPCIQLLGFVENYDDFVRSCTVFLAPLRFGGGVKIKVLDALACARPVVTTAIGAEGIPADARHGLQVADTAQGLADLVLAHLSDPTPGAAAAVRGAEFIAKHHGVTGKVQRFEQEVARLLPADAASNAGRPAA